MKTIVFYISGHGFGHSTRSIALMNAIPEEYGLEIRTSAPAWLFELNMKRSYQLSYCEADVGAVQPNCLQLEREKTLCAFASLVDKEGERLAQESDWARSRNTRLILFDIPSLAPRVARRIGVPSVGVSNFSWDEIYQPYVTEFPEYEYLIDALASDYAETTLLLRLPFHLPMSAFPVIEDWPLLARVSKADRLEVREGLGLPKDACVVLLSYGGFRLADIVGLSLESFHGYFFLSFFQEPLTQASNYRNLSKNECPHEDAVKAADIVMTKPGYGIVSECIANQTAILYTEREDFLEYSKLVEGIERHLVQEHISQDDLLAGRWKFFLDLIAQKLSENVPSTSIEIDDGHLAAARALEMI